MATIDEVRSYWQVASIAHFCNYFGKAFKLPSFDVEELEHAFITDIPNFNAANQDDDEDDGDDFDHHKSNGDHADNDTAGHEQESNKNRKRQHEDSDEDGDEDSDETGAKLKKDEQDDSSDFDYKAPRTPGLVTTNGRSASSNCNNHYSHATEQHISYLRPKQTATNNNRTLDNNTINNNKEPNQIHLLAKIAIPLLRPHFNCKIAPENWERFLNRLIDANWLELEQFPSPLRVPIVSTDGVELIKNLTFNQLNLSDKIDIFNALCDYRLWCDDATDAIKDYSLEELRLESAGKDSKGYEYWYFWNGTRLYREKKELVDDIIVRSQQIAKLNDKLVGLEKKRILREKEEEKKVELERIRREAAEAREQRLALKKSEEKTKRRRLRSPPTVPLRAGLRERRTSAASNTSTPCAESNNSNNKSARSFSKFTSSTKKQNEPQQPQKFQEEIVKEELEKLKITSEERKESWQMQCESLEDWEEFVAQFEKSKSTNEKYLHAYLNQEVLPLIRDIYNKRAAEARRKEKEMLLALTSRRLSSRIICKKAQEEEEERQAHIREEGMRRKKVEAEIRLRAELEREIRVRKNKFPIDDGSSCSVNGEDSGRYSLRTQISVEFEGIIHPDKLSDFYEALELVIDTVRTCKHAWPFVEPVPRTVPNYYDLITEPMDLRKLRNKIEFREYKCFMEVEKDFQLIINNCERFNGPTNTYTKMSYKLWKVFRKNVRIFLQHDVSMDEYETFIYPPKPKEEPKIEEEPKQEEEMMDEEVADERGDPDEDDELVKREFAGVEEEESPRFEPIDDGIPATHNNVASELARLEPVREEVHVTNNGVASKEFLSIEPVKSEPMIVQPVEVETISQTEVEIEPVLTTTMEMDPMMINHIQEDGQEALVACYVDYYSFQEMDSYNQSKDNLNCE